MSRKEKRKRDRTTSNSGNSGVPVRTCVGCRRRRPQSEMIRFVRPSGDSDFLGRTLPGRGRYVCPGAGCLDRLEKGLGRWFTPDEKMKVIEALRERVLGGSTGGE